MEHWESMVVISTSPQMKSNLRGEKLWVWDKVSLNLFSRLISYNKLLWPKYVYVYIIWVKIICQFVCVTYSIMCIYNKDVSLSMVTSMVPSNVPLMIKSDVEREREREREIIRIESVFSVCMYLFLVLRWFI